jgi:hypothetical protein
MIALLFQQHLALAVANQFDRPPEKYPSGGEVAEGNGLLNLWTRLLGTSEKRE